MQDAYLKDEGGWPVYYELRNQLLKKGTFDSLGKEDVANGIIFIDGNPELNDENGSGKPGGPMADAPQSNSLAIMDYANFGPNNELYLAPGQAVAFDMDFGSGAKSVHLAYKTVGGTAKVKVYNGELDEKDVTASQLNTATDLYYDITVLNGKTIVIYNAGNSNDAVLSITNIKVTYDSDPGAKPTDPVFTVSRDTANQALASLPGTQPDNGTTDDTETDPGKTPPSENEDPGTSVPGVPSTEENLVDGSKTSTATLVGLVVLAVVIAVLGCGLVIFAIVGKRR